MSRGLDAILERIKQNPSSTLVSRYLSLVAELADEGEKARRAMAVATVIQDGRPAEALNIAHMVYASGFERLAALDVMITALEARGRHGKATVLRTERERIAKSGGDEGREGRGKSPSLDLDDDSDGELARAQTTVHLDDEGSREGEAGHHAGDEADGASRSDDGTAALEPIFAVKRHAALRGVKAPLQPQASSTAAPWLSVNKVNASSAIGHGRERIIVPQRGAPREAPVREGGPRDPGAIEPEARGAMQPDEPSLGLDSDPSLNVERLFPASQGEDLPAVPQPLHTRVSTALPDVASLGVGEESALLSHLVDAASQHVPPGGKLDLFAMYGKSAHEAGIASAPPVEDAPAPQPAAMPSVPATGLGAAVELFDHYWRQGFVDDAREILVQTAPVAGGEPWWQARNALVARSSTAGGGRLDTITPPSSLVAAGDAAGDAAAGAARALAFGRGHAAPEPAALSPKSPPVRDIAWKPLYAELLRIAVRQRLPVASQARRDLLSRALAGKPLPEGFVKALAAVGSVHLNDRSRQLLWDLVAILWSSGPDESCLSLLKALGLQDAEPRWLGLYSDALLATGRVTQVIPALRRALCQSGRSPLLDWARVGMLRLPQTWAALGVTGFQWSEDEGVAALIARLEVRPRPRLASLVASDVMPRQPLRA